MQLKNVERAKKIDNELKEIELAIAKTTLLAEKSTGFLLSEHSDQSGISVGYIYLNGNYPKELYKAIAEDALKRFKEYKEKLLEEIETL